MGRKKHSYFIFLHTILCLALNSTVIFSWIAYINDVLHARDISIKIYFFDYILLSFFLPMMLTGLFFVLTFVTLLFGMLQNATYSKCLSKSDYFGIKHNRLSIVTTILTLGSVLYSYGFMFYHIFYLDWANSHIVAQHALNQKWVVFHNIGYIDWKFSILLLVLVCIASMLLVGISIADFVISTKMRRGA